MHHKELYTIFQIRLLEKMAVEQFQIEEFTLMKTAGKAAFDHLVLNWPNANKIHVICGSGNNAGDGLILAYHAKKADYDVIVHHLDNLERLSPCASKAFIYCQENNIECLPFDSDLIATGDVGVDALLGIGIKEKVRSTYAKVIDDINKLRVPILSIDVPSGLDADTGTVLGHAVKATHTITFIGLKQGLFTHDGKDYSGTIHLSTLDLPDRCYEAVPYSAKLLVEKDVSTIARRPSNSQKGDFGHVLIIGGDSGMAGAARLAAEAALRSGAGLVSVATHPENAAIICARYPEIMCHEITEASELESLLERATVVVLGPGLGQRDWGRHLFQAALGHSLPMIIDADGLNLLGKNPVCQPHWIMTPHPGEASRLLGLKAAKEVQADRFMAITSLIGYGGVWVLKGAGTLVAEKESVISVCPYGNAGMASGGMGDALSGVIGGFVAQRLGVLKAAELGVLVHALAGDEVAERSGQVGMVASDLIEMIPTVIDWA